MTITSATSNASTPQPFDIDALAATLAARSEALGIPGASLAIARESTMHRRNVGVANLNTGLPVTDDTIFQIGSITKVVTATVLMRLLDAGGGDLDDAVGYWIPDLAKSEVTLRQLLTHTSGLDGDFATAGWGDDALTAFVHAFAEQPTAYAPGEVFSYSNAGFSLLGRVIELITGQTWDEAVAEHIAAPLGLRSFVTLPWDAIVHPVAVGHLPNSEGKLDVATPWGESRSAGPNGGVVASAADLLQFALTHLPDDPGTLLASATRQLMQTPVLSIPDGYPESARQGLGWQLSKAGSEWAVGHNGWMLGQSSFLRLLPDRSTAVCLLTNANGFTSGLLFADLWQELTGGVAATTPGDTTPDNDGEKQYAGTYAMLHGTNIVTGPPLEMSIKLTGPMAQHFGGQLSATLQRAGGPGQFRAVTDFGAELPVAFTRDTAGAVRYLHVGGRAQKRVPE